MLDESDLSTIQMEWLRRLERTLGDLGRSLKDREFGEIPTAGMSPNTVYVTGRIDGTDVTVFLYDDGEAQLHGAGVQRIFEIWDFPEEGRLEALWNAFENAIREVVGS